MPSETPRGFRVFTVSFPPELASLVDEIAHRESRTISKMLREAFRHYADLLISEQYPVAQTGAFLEDRSPFRTPAKRADA